MILKRGKFNKKMKLVVFICMPLKRIFSQSHRIQLRYYKKKLFNNVEQRCADVSIQVNYLIKNIIFYPYLDKKFIYIYYYRQIILLIKSIYLNNVHITECTIHVYIIFTLQHVVLIIQISIVFKCNRWFFLLKTYETNVYLNLSYVYFY